jgi:predicted RNase H-like HicB family nuclease
LKIETLVIHWKLEIAKLEILWIQAKEDAIILDTILNCFMSQITHSFSLPVFILREGKNYIAYSPVLDLSTSAASVEKAEKRFSEAANIFFEELVEESRLDDVLSDLGWIREKKQWSPPVIIEKALKKMKITV